MALAFGGGVRPELGRTDYTSFLQGSLAGSQMAARGGESIGKALAGMGQDFATGIEKYQQNKKITAEMIGNAEGIISANPNIIAEAPPVVGKLLQELQERGTLPMHKAMQLNGYLAGQEKALESKAKIEQAKVQNEYTALRSSIIKQQQTDQDALSRIAQNIQMFRNPEGKLDAQDIVSTFVSFGGRDTSVLKQFLESGEEEFKPTAERLEVPGTDRFADVVRTGPKTTQVLPEIGEVKLPASIADRQAQETFINEAGKLWKEGNRLGALAKAIAGGVKGQFGGPPSMMDLENMFRDLQNGNDVPEESTPKATGNPREIRVSF
jgi:hypothetical protein